MDLHVEAGGVPQKGLHVFKISWLTAASTSACRQLAYLPFKDNSGIIFHRTPLRNDWSQQLPSSGRIITQLNCTQSLPPSFLLFPLIIVLTPPKIETGFAKVIPSLSAFVEATLSGD